MHALLSVRPHVAPRGGGADTPLLPPDKELFKKTGVMIVGVSGDAADTTAHTATSLHTFAKREKHDAKFIVFAVLIPILVLLSGLFAGLTLGYMSLDETQLHVLSISGTA